MRETVLNSCFELRELLVIFGIKALLFDEFPKSLNQVEIRRISRQIEQFDVEGVCQVLQEFAFLVAGVV